MKTFAFFACMMLVAAQNTPLNVTQTAMVFKGLYDLDLPTYGVSTDIALCVSDFLQCGADIAEAVSDFQADKIAQGCAQIADCVNIVPDLIDNCGFDPSEEEAFKINSIDELLTDMEENPNFVTIGAINNYSEVRRFAQGAQIAFEEGDLVKLGRFMASIIVSIARGQIE